MKSQHGSVGMAYNVQSSVDAKAHIILDYDISLNPSNQNQLSIMVRKVKKRFHLRHFTVLADKGYYNGEDLEKVKHQAWMPLCPSRKRATQRTSRQLSILINSPMITQGDFYICPTGN